MDMHERIAFAVEKSGRSKTQLAKDLGVTRSAIYQWLDGTTEPTPRNVLMLARAANLRPEWLILEERPMEYDSSLTGALNELASILVKYPEDQRAEALKEIIRYADFRRTG